MTDDGQLLRQYVRQGSQAAFSQLVARHLNFVYSVCQREVGDAVLAEDVTQVVFLLLAKKASALRVEASLSGWLFQTARFAAKNARRREANRKMFEQKMSEQMPPIGQDENTLWNQLEPHLNDALASLGTQDRTAVLLRFADGLSFPELSAVLGTSEDAARMRLNRAVERLRKFFATEGVTLSGVVLIGLLTDRTVQAAPTTCTVAIAKIANGVIAGGVTNSVSVQVQSQLQGVLKAMVISKLKFAATLGVGIVLAGSLPFVTWAQNPVGNTASYSTPMASFVMPGAHAGNSATVSQMQMAMYTSDRPFEEVCQFYSRLFLDSNFKTLGINGAQGNNDTHSVYALHQKPGVHTAVFCQHTPKYSVSAFVTRGAGENETEVTLVYEPR